MDDCNDIAEADGKRLKIGSDSSMDDCNPDRRLRRMAMNVVQIPLWTIVTARLTTSVTPPPCSDSSMDDCNSAEMKEAIYVVTGSDSSMDDCNVPQANSILLGKAFRFLYGRL